MEVVLLETSATVLCWSLSQNLHVGRFVRLCYIWISRYLWGCAQINVLFLLFCMRIAIEMLLDTLIFPNKWNLDNIQTGLFRKKNRIVSKGFFYNWKKLFWFGLVIFGFFLDDCWTFLQNLKFEVYVSK